MKIVLAAAAALMMSGLGVSSANAEPYRHREPGVRIVIGSESPREYRHGHRHHYRPHHCWTEKERFRDRHGRLHIRTVRVCR